MNSSFNLSEPRIFHKEIRLVNKALKRNELAIGGNLKKFEQSLKKYLNIKHVTLCSSGSNALITIMKILDLNYQNEIILPTLTFVAPVSACTLFKAKPIFFDCDKFHNIDLKKVIEFIENKTLFLKNRTINKKTKRWIKAIVLVHVWGNACEIDQIYKLCKKRNIKIIEDASESIGTKYRLGHFKNKYTGTVGDIACLSFNGNKIITTGSGGAIITNNKEYAKKAKLYINHCKTDTIKFIHSDEGFNFRMNNIQASIGLGQLKKINYFIKKKKNINKKYKLCLSRNKKYIVNSQPKYSDNNCWLTLVTSQKPKDTIQIIKKLIRHKINVRKPWYPNHLQKPFKKYETYKISNAQKVFRSSICMPSSADLNYKQIQRITKFLHD